MREGRDYEGTHSRQRRRWVMTGVSWGWLEAAATFSMVWRLWLSSFDSWGDGTPECMFRPASSGVGSRVEARLWRLGIVVFGFPRAGALGWYGGRPWRPG